MKKLVILGLFLSLFVLGGFVDNSVQAASFENSLLSFDYPDDWQLSDDTQGSVFVAISNERVGNFSANMNVVNAASDPHFNDFSIDTFKEQYEQGLNQTGRTNVKFIVAERINWHNASGIYLEYTSNYSGMPIHYIQVFRDDGKNLVVLTFISAQDSWENFGKQANDVLMSISFK